MPWSICISDNYFPTMNICKSPLFILSSYDTHNFLALLVTVKVIPIVAGFLSRKIAMPLFIHISIYNAILIDLALYEIIQGSWLTTFVENGKEKPCKTHCC